MRKWAKRIFLLLILVVLIGVGWVYSIIRRSNSAIDGTVLVDGISQPVKIVRDIHGVPHIFAQNRCDLAFALGYAQAQDRLWQIDLGRHLGQGTLSQVFGPVPLVMETDLFFRTVFSGFDREAYVHRMLEALSPEVRDELTSFLQGINTFVALHADKLPVEHWITRHDFEPLRLDVLGGLPLLWFLSLNFDDELLATKIAAKLESAPLIELFPEAPVTILPGEVGAILGTPLSHMGKRVSVGWTKPFEGLSHEALVRLTSNLETLPVPIRGTNVSASNSWVVGGARTTTGKPFLASDPHLAIGMPSIWYEAHLVAPGVDVIGVTLPSFPYIMIGHNRSVAWGNTNVMADNQDLFIERVNPDNPQQVWFIDHWEDMRVEKVTIPAKGVEPVEHEIHSTRHGPIITSLSPGITETLAVQWAITQGTPEESARSLEGYRRLNTATNWEEFRAAVKSSMGAQNFMYADVDGNIGWQVSGVIPVRAKGDGRFPVPGWTGKYEWTGTIPFEELPSYYLSAGSDEPSVTGSLVPAAPTFAIATANQRIVRDDYPHPLSHSWVPPYRFLRIDQLLGQNEKMSLEDMKRYQGDLYSLFADVLVPLLEEELATETSEDLQWSVRILREWDRRVKKDSAAAVLYELTLLHLMKNVYADELGELYADYAQRSGFLYSGLDGILHLPKAQWWDDVKTPTIETRRDILCRSVQEAVEDARQRLGTDPAVWQWGELHHAIFSHPLGRFWPLDWFFNRSVPCDGDNQTVNVGAYKLDEPFDVFVAPSFRMVVDLSDIAHAFAMNTTGQSGRPFTRHYDDMIQPWVDGHYHPMWTHEEEILGHAEGTLVLMPQTAPGSTE